MRLLLPFRSRAPRLAGIALPLLLAGCGGAAAEEEGDLLPAEVVCRRCTIELRPVLTLGDSAGPGRLEGDSLGVAVDGRGRFLVWNAYSPWVKVFGPDGRFVAVVGRPGTGPGRFRGVGFVQVTTGDTVHVFDRENARHSVFSPDLRFLRGQTLEVGPERAAVVFSEDRLILPRTVAPPERTKNLPLQRYEGGIWVFAFRMDWQPADQTRTYPDERLIAPSSGKERFWSVQRHRYVLEEFGLDGSLRRGGERRTETFPVVWRPVSVSPDQAPTPLLTGVREASDDRVWITTAVAAERWRDAVVPDGNGGHALAPGVPYREHAIDLVRTRNTEELTILATGRLPGPVLLLDGNRAATVETGEDGARRLVIARIELTDPDGELARR